MNDYLLKMENVIKAYSGVLALNNVNFDIKAGEVHALLGENGAGKSTLIKVLSGAVLPDSGSVIFEGQEYRHLDPIKTKKMGISVIHQELNNIAYLNVAENICLGNEPKKSGNLIIDSKKMYTQVTELLGSMNVHNLNPKTQLMHLSVAYQQLVEIAKAVFINVKLLIMDEPTAPLSEHETENLFRLIKKLKEDGIAIIYISHRIEEIFEIADRVTVLRDGNYIDTLNIGDTNKNHLISLMIGRELTDEYPEKTAVVSEDDIVMSVQNLNSIDVKNINFNLKRGEILGFAGLVGAGRTETVRAICGVDPIATGEVILENNIVSIKAPHDAINHGLGLLPEDRKRHGVFLMMGVKENITMAIMKRLKGFILLNSKKVVDVSNDYVEKLNIRTPGLEQNVQFLSGGNQQKVVLAKWLAANSKVLIFDEPTRGVDVGAKQEIYQLMREITKNGVSIIMISSEMPELLGMSDRILVMYGGMIKAELDKSEFSQKRILEIASGDD